MSLINKALKEEQQRRQAQTGPVAPMVARSMAARKQGDRGVTLLIGFTLAGLLSAAVVTIVVFFVSSFATEEESGSPQSSASFTSGDAENTAAVASNAPNEPQAAHSKSLIEALDPDELAAVQQLIEERRRQNSGVAEALDPSNFPPEPVNKPEPIQRARGAEQDRIQAIIDGYSVQGIRKAGRNSRIFMNGKMHGIGSVVDNANGIRIIGFNDFALILEDKDGFRYEKTY